MCYRAESIRFRALPARQQVERKGAPSVFENLRIARARPPCALWRFGALQDALRNEEDCKSTLSPLVISQSSTAIPFTGVLRRGPNGHLQLWSWMRGHLCGILPLNAPVHQLSDAPRGRVAVAASTKVNRPTVVGWSYIQWGEQSRGCLTGIQKNK